MRIVSKILFKSATALTSAAMMALTLFPVTENEVDALGRDYDRSMLIQMRLAKVMLTVAPEFAVARFAAASDLPDHVVRNQLEAAAEGAPMMPHNQYDFADSEDAGVPTTPSRRTEAGGALFAKPD